MDQMGETYKVRRIRNNDWTEVIDFDFPKVRKCEEMWSLGTDRPGTPCAVLTGVGAPPPLPLLGGVRNSC